MTKLTLAKARQTRNEARLDVYLLPMVVNQAHVDESLRRRLATTKSPTMHKRLTALIAARARLVAELNYI